jgi:hypothetical protein
MFGQTAGKGVDAPEFVAGLPKLVDLDRSASVFNSSVQLITPGRRFFRTEKGLLGLGQPSCLEGDQIRLIINSHLPFVLRPTGTGTYTFVGECYMQGFMHGETLDDRWGLREQIGPVNLV